MERRYSRGLYLLNSFTWSRARDNASGHLEVQNGDNSRVNYRDLDVGVRRVRLRPAAEQHDQLRVGAAVRQGPAVRGEPEPGDGRHPRRLAARRHQHDDERRADQPVLYAPAAASSVGGTVTYRPNLTGDPLTPDGAISNYLNPATVEIPTDRSQPFGNAPRNVARATPSTSSTSACTRGSACRGIRRRLEARVEAFNVLNKTNFRSANGNRSASAFGTITTTYPARQIQLGVKFYF